MEAIYEFDVVDMPVTVAVDATGESVTKPARKERQAKIGRSRLSPAKARPLLFRNAGSAGHFWS